MKRIKLSVLLLAAIIFLTLQVACEEATATPVPSLEYTPESTATARVTATPLPPHAPQLLERSPARGEEQPVDEPLVLRFDQSMDRTTVEEAFALAPDVAGQFSWEDDATLVFQPEAPFERDGEYQVQIESSAQAQNGISLAREISYGFRTVGYLEITQVYPGDGATEIDTETDFRVAFNRPVVPLASVSDQENLLDPLTFEPAVEGEGEWVNSSIYRFQPEEPLLAGITYTVRASAGLSDTTGGILAEDVIWSFITELPRVTETFPRDGERLAAPQGAIQIIFNQPMDQASVEEAFSLTAVDAGRSLRGKTAWQDEAFVFTPTQTLERGVEYDAVLSTEALAVGSEAAIESEYAWQFRVAPEPELVSMDPRDGDEGVPLYERMSLIFSAPMSRTSLMDGLSIAPETDVYVYLDENNTAARVSANLSPSTRYTFTLAADVVDRYGQELGRSSQWTFTTAPYEPSLTLNVPGTIGIHSLEGSHQINAYGYNIDEVNLALYQVTPAEFVRVTGGRSWVNLERDEPQGDLLRRWSVPVDAALNERAYITTTVTGSVGAALPSGIFYLEASAPGVSNPDRRLLINTALNLTLKSSDDNALVWATDLTSGEPLSDVDVSLFITSTDPVAEGTTDEDGIALLNYAQTDRWQPLMLIAESDQGTGIVLRDWTDGISPWEFGLESSYMRTDHQAHLYTDRQIYRPGQTVYLKGILRRDEDARYSLPMPGEMITVSITDSEGRDVWREALPLSQMGTFDSEFTLDEEAALGSYQLLAEYEPGSFQAYMYFTVAEYRAPEFEASATTDKSDYLQGEEIDVEAEASYYFGGPVANAEVYWQVTRSAYSFDRWEGKGHYHFGDYENSMDEFYGGFNELVAEATGQADGDGRFTVSIPAEIADLKQSQRFQIEVSYVDSSNQEVTARTSAIVHKGAFYVGLSPRQYVGTAGEEQTIDVVTVDTQGEPLGDRSMQVVLYRHEWYTVREERSDGDFYWVNKSKDTPVMTKTVTTDADGLGEVALTPPEGGSYRVVASAEDDAGREIVTSIYIWVSGEEYVNWGREDHPRIELVADADEYAPGDTAQILVPSPFEAPITALVTIERDHVLSHRLVTLESNSEQLQVPIEAAHAPNVYVSVVLIKGSEDGKQPAEIRIGYVMLPVSAEQQKLNVSVTAEGSGPYKPRDKVTYQVETRDYRGDPISAEVSLQLVDLAVQALVGDSGQDIVQSFYHERALGVNTAATLIKSLDLVAAEAAEAKGGGGGPGQDMTRSIFPDTAYWNPAVQTDEDGHAEVTVTLPDNLTTWRMTAQAVTEDTLVGSDETDIVTNLDLMVRPTVPRFAVVGDEPILGAVVHNNTDSEHDVQISLSAQGAELEDAQQEVTIAAHDSANVSWPAQVLPTDELVLLYQAETTTDALQDAIEISLPVHHPTTPETVGTAGVVEDRIMEVIRPPEEARSDQGGLELRLEPSLAASMREGLDYVSYYPYLCTEQIVSRFLPNVVTERALEQLGIENHRLSTRLAQQIGPMLQRLYASQNLDGGWGWWSSRESNPLLTAYALYGMAEAKASDFVVDQRVMDSAISYLYDWFKDVSKNDSASLDTQAAVVHALAMAGQGDLGRTVTLYDDRDELSLHGKAYLAMTLQELAPDQEERLSTLRDELTGAAILSATGAHWEEAERSPWSMSTDTRATAMVLRALVQLDEDVSLLPNAVRWLTIVRENGRWETTQENVWAILALTDYMVATGELEADYDYGLAVNGVDLAQGAVSADTVEEPVTATVAMADLSLGQDNLVLMERTPEDAPGKLYYSIFLNYYLPIQDIPALNRGIFVQREYTLLDDPDRPIERAKTNDIIEVKLTIIAPHDLHYLVIEDPIPAGCEIVDTGLATSRSLEESQGLQKPTEKKEQQSWWWYGFQPAHTERRDEKLALFADQLQRGTYEYRYHIRCTTPGEYGVIPAQAYEMYFPDQFGRSAGETFLIEEE